MHPPMPPPPPRRVAGLPRPSRVSFERKLDDFTVTAAAAPVLLPLLRRPRVPGAFGDAEAEPSERSTADHFFERADYGKKTGVDAEAVLRLERPIVRRRVPCDEKAGAFGDAEADPSERSTANPFFERTDYGEKTPALDNDAGPGPWVLPRTGLLFSDPRVFGDDKKKTGVDAEAVLCLGLMWRTGGRPVLLRPDGVRPRGSAGPGALQPL